MKCWMKIDMQSDQFGFENDVFRHDKYKILPNSNRKYSKSFRLYLHKSHGKPNYFVISYFFFSYAPVIQVLPQW